MPRYFFDIAEGDTRSDWNEADLPDREAARRYAIGIAETIMRDKVFEGQPPESVITIRNAAGEITDVVRSDGD